jgi:hypothetical protein
MPPQRASSPPLWRGSFLKIIYKGYIMVTIDTIIWVFVGWMISSIIKNITLIRRNIREIRDIKRKSKFINPHWEISEVKYTIPEKKK